jgi:AraC family transcriptional regulator
MNASSANGFHPGHRAFSRAYEVSGITLSETTYHPLLRMPSHKHEDEAYFSFVLRGGFTEYRGRRSQEIKKSALVFHAADETRSGHFHNQPTHLFNVRLNINWLRSLCEQTTVLNSSSYFIDGRLIGLIQKLYREFKNPDTMSSLVIEGLTLEMLGETIRESGRTSTSNAPRWLTQVRDLLDARFHENLKLSAIAACVGVHPAHLSRAFHQHYRCTLGDYVRRLRIEEACRALVTSDTSLTEIALTSGFSDQSHFSRTFKRFTGHTPAQHRALFGR